MIPFFWLWMPTFFAVVLKVITNIRSEFENWIIDKMYTPTIYIWQKNNKQHLVMDKTNWILYQTAFCKDINFCKSRSIRVMSRTNKNYFPDFVFANLFLPVSLMNELNDFLLFSDDRYSHLPGNASFHVVTQKLNFFSHCPNRAS